MATEKKEDTSIRLRKRKYEERHKEERQKATKVFSTLIKTEQLAEINAFLAKHHITKVNLVFAGYEALKSEYGPKDEQNKE